MKKKQKNEYINNTLLLHPHNKNLKVKSTIIIDQIQNNILDINQIKIKKNNIIKKDFNKKKIIIIIIININLKVIFF